jgi:hypothetical protein
MKNNLLVALAVVSLRGGTILIGADTSNDPTHLNDYLVFPKHKTELTYQDHHRTCAVCVRFTQGRVTTRALEILRAHLTGHRVDIFGKEPGPAIQGSIVQDGLEFKTPCPRYMYIYQFKSDGLPFDSLAKFVLEKQYEGGLLGVTRGSCAAEEINK